MKALLSYSHGAVHDLESVDRPKFEALWKRALDGLPVTLLVFRNGGGGDSPNMVIDHDAATTTTTNNPVPRFVFSARGIQFVTLGIPDVERVRVNYQMYSCLLHLQPNQVSEYSYVSPRVVTHLASSDRPVGEFLDIQLICEGIV